MDKTQFDLALLAELQIQKDLDNYLKKGKKATAAPSAASHFNAAVKRKRN